MKGFRKIYLVVIIILMVILSVPAYLVYTRVSLDTYEMKGDTLYYENSKYELERSFDPSSSENAGKIVGIAVEGKRTITDYIWPFWILEFKNDKEHKRLMVRGLMYECTYSRVSQ